MFLIIIGLITLIVVSAVAKNNPAVAKFVGVGRLVGLLFVVVGIMTACVKQIDAGEIGVKNYLEASRTMFYRVGFIL